MAKISRIWAREIIDSRGIPTVEAVCQLDTGHIAVSSVPGGTSTGSYEALELRDNDPKRYKGKGVLTAVSNINKILGPAIIGVDPNNQVMVDERLISTDGTENKSKYGANAILALSEVVTKVSALSNSQTLYEKVFHLSQELGLKPLYKIPTPLYNMINGGLHGAGNLDFQEFHLIPASNKKYGEGLQMAIELYMTIGENLAKRKAIHSVGDEGGYAPNLFTNADAFEVLMESIRESGYALGRDIFFGLDVAASTFFRGGEYVIKDKISPLDENAMLEYYKNLNQTYHLALLEDAFHEDAWESWKKLVIRLGSQVTIVGDDLLATNPKRVMKAIKEKAANGILVKPNQIGTVTETLKVIKLAQDADWKIVVSHRSGETNDWFIADFAVGVGADYVKFGAPARGERVAKYNRLLSIETELSLALK